VESVSGLCGHLPLALRIAGTRLASRPQWTVAGLIDRLVDAERRLAALSAGDTGVASSFALSHAQLSPAAAILFRRLAHVPGADFAAPVAAVLSGTEPAEAEDRLEELVELGLLQPEGSDRYRFHDLIRLYAADRLRSEETPDERTATERRMTRWLLETTIVAGRWYQPDRGTLPDGWTDTVQLTTLEEAHAWLQAETDNWLGALRSAAADGRHQLVVDLSDATFWYSVTCAEWPGWYEVSRMGNAAAAELPDLHQRARQLRCYAWVLTHAMRRPEEGADLAMTAYRMAEEIGDLSEQIDALGVLGSAWGRLGRYEEAEWASRAERELAGRAGDHDQYVTSILGLGFLLERAGRPDEAVDEHQQAIAELERRPVSPQVIAYIRSHASYGIAAAHGSAARWPESLLAAERAMPMVTDIEDALVLGYLLIVRGRAHAGLGHTAAARADLTRGIELVDTVWPVGGPRDRIADLARETLAELDK